MGTSLDESRNSTWRLFLVSQRQIVERIQDMLAMAQLPPLEWYDVLWALKQAPEQQLRLSDLADQVLLSRSNLTRLLDRLEKKGLVQREACPTDRRGTFAVLTQAGSDMQERMWDVYSKGISLYFGDRLNDEDIKRLNQTLKKIIGAIAP